MPVGGQPTAAARPRVAVPERPVGRAERRDRRQRDGRRRRRRRRAPFVAPRANRAVGRGGHCAFRRDARQRGSEAITLFHTSKFDENCASWTPRAHLARPVGVPASRASHRARRRALGVAARAFRLCIAGARRRPEVSPGPAAAAGAPRGSRAPDGAARRRASSGLAPVRAVLEAPHEPQPAAGAHRRLLFAVDPRSRKFDAAQFRFSSRQVLRERARRWHAPPAGHRAAAAAHANPLRPKIRRGLRQGRRAGGRAARRRLRHDLARLRRCNSGFNLHWHGACSTSCASAT